MKLSKVFFIFFYDPVSVTVHSLTLFKLNESAGTRGHPLKSHKKTISYSSMTLPISMHISLSTHFLNSERDLHTK